MVRQYLKQTVQSGHSLMKYNSDPSQVLVERKGESSENLPPRAHFQPSRQGESQVLQCSVYSQTQSVWASQLGQIWPNLV